MGNFNRGGGGGYGGNRGNGGGFRGNRGGGFGGGRDGGRPNYRREDRGPVTMTQAICDECKKSCEVPFKPTAGKPIYCNDCFRGQSAGQDRAPRRDFNDRSQQAPRPSFTVGNESGNDTKKQLELLNSKMDKLITSIENLAHAKPAAKTEVVKSMVVSLPKKDMPAHAGTKKVVKKKTGKK